jgi:RimJ/RimL family protein N-acetyltransferase
VAPYPAEQSRVVAWQGKATRVRPLEAADQAAYLRLLAAMEPLDIRLRVFSSRRSLTQGELEQLTDIDYAREVALVVTPADDPNTLLGVARASHSTQSPNPEIGVMVRSDLKGQGLGTVLMTDLLATLRARGCTRAELSVLDENKAMLALAKRLGFTEQGAAAGDMTRTLAIDLSR